MSQAVYSTANPGAHISHIPKARAGRIRELHFALQCPSVGFGTRVLEPVKELGNLVGRVAVVWQKHRWSVRPDPFDFGVRGSCVFTWTLLSACPLSFLPWNPQRSHPSLPLAPGRPIGKNTAAV